jgi:hypothetical protein
MTKRTLLACVVAWAIFLSTLSTAFAALPAEPACASSSTIFCSGLEEGNFSIWDDWDGNPSATNALVSDPGPLNLSGNSVARLRAPTGRGGADITKVLPSTYDKVYVRWYQKWEAGYDFNAPNHGGGLHAGDRNLAGHSDDRPSGSDWFSAWLEPQYGRLNLYVYYRGMYQDCANPSGQCWGDHFPCFVGDNYCTKAEHRPRTMPPIMQSDRWYCLEMMVDGGAASSTAANAGGALDFWIDGVQYGPWNNLWLRTTPSLKVSLLTLGLFLHGEHTPAGIMIDNVVTSREHVGCSNSVRPNPPTNVRSE